MGQALTMCPACTPFCATRCCGCCVVVPQGLQRELIRHRDVFRALGLRHQHLVVLWQTFQSFDQDASGNLLLPEFLAGVGLADSVIAKRAFDVLDDERTERLCFYEFCRALVVYCTFDKNALSLFSFDVFDFDGDGVLSGPDVQRAVLTVYGTNAGSGATTAKLLDNAKAMAQRYSGGDAAKFSGGKRFALDRRAFDMFVREVPTLCFPVFTVQHRLWERCGGQAFWKSITRDRHARAKHKLRSLPGRGSTYEFNNWRDLVADVGTPTSDQKASLTRLGLITPKGGAGSSGGQKGRRHSSYRFAGGGPAGGSAGSAGSAGRRASMGSQPGVAAGSGSDSLLRRNRESKVTVASRSRADTGGVAGPSVDSRTGVGKDRISRGDLDFTDVAEGMAGLKKHEVATVAVFGSAAERRAAAVAMGTVSREQLQMHKERRKSLAQENLSAIRKMTGQDAYEADDYRRHNKLASGARAGKLRRESSKGRRTVVEAQSLSAPVAAGPSKLSARSALDRTGTSPRVTVVTGTATTAAGSRVAASPMHDVGFF